MSRNRRRIPLFAVLALVASLVLAPGPLAASAQPRAAVSSNVHLFYYPWYGSPAVHGDYRHWQ